MPDLHVSRHSLFSPRPATIAAATVMLLALTACGKGEAPKAAGGGGHPAPEVGVVVATPTNVGLVTELPGRLEATRVAEVRARAAGILMQRVFQEGSDVKAGQVLFRIDPAPYAAAAASAEASLARAEANAVQARALAERYKPLVEANAVSKQEYLNAVAAAKTADADIAVGRAALQTAKINLGYATVTAPISGRIGRSLVTEGALVGQGDATALAVIQQINPLYVNFTQSATEVLRLRRALQDGQFKRAGGDEPPACASRSRTAPSTPQPGRLLFSDLTVDQTTGQVTLRAEVPNPKGDLLPGLYVRVRLEQAQATNAITVPQQAVTRTQQGDTLTVVGADGKLSKRTVKISAAQNNQWVVLDGLKAGEQVMVDGFQKLQMMPPGTPVKAVPWTGRRAPPPRLRLLPLRPPRLRPRSKEPARMAKFFIDRPIFAWVIALFILVVGGVAITQLPIAQYPPVAPPAIVINAAYPGASAQTLEDSVLSVIEREMNGSPGMIYMESVAQADGTGAITISFAPGTDADLAQVDVQNRLSRATPRLPAAVTQQGVRVDKSRSNFLLFTILSSDNPAYDPIALGDYASRNVVPELQRVKGIGQAQLFGTERAMRVWIDPAKMQGFNLSSSDVTNAIKAQNAQVASGTIGDLPNVAGQAIAATVVVNGQLTNVEQFGNIVLRANTDGSAVRLRDVARIELGGQAYSTSARLNGEPAVGIGVQLAPSGNALESARLVRAKMEELSRFFPQGVKWEIPYDSSRFVKISISQVAETLVEAVVLVFLVMFLFLQNWRYTHHPDHRGADRAAGHLRRAAGAGLLDQRADDVRHGAGDRHRGRRRHRGGRERRAHHERGRAAAAGGHAQGDEADLGRHHRRHGGADLGVRPAGLLRRLGRQHLPPVLGRDGGLDRRSRPSWRCR